MLLKGLSAACCPHLDTATSSGVTASEGHEVTGPAGEGNRCSVETWHLLPPGVWKGLLPGHLPEPPAKASAAHLEPLTPRALQLWGQMAVLWLGRLGTYSLALPSLPQHLVNPHH